MPVFEYLKFKNSQIYIVNYNKFNEKIFVNISKNIFSILIQDLDSIVKIIVKF